MARVVLGVGGGIAAYKACDLVRRLREAGHGVRVVPTAAALQFVGAATWEALSGEPVATGVWTDVPEVLHVRLGREADLVLVAPATADLLARAAAGMADDLLTSTLLTARCPVVFAPAMHTEMWEHPATRANVAMLRARGALVIDPAVGRLTGPDSGPGRLPEPGQLAELARAVLARGGLGQDLQGRHVVISAGGTREPLDPVRFLGNRSSGRQGVALAATALARGARVTLVAANLAVPAPSGAEVVPVGSAQELCAAVLPLAQSADAVVMAAAVADFRPVEVADSKIKKSGSTVPEVRLEQTVDVLAAVVTARRQAQGQAQSRSPGGSAGWSQSQVIVGFAAETGDSSGDARAHGRAKLARKGADLLVVNEVGPPGHPTGFEGTRNAALLLASDGSEVEVPLGSKEALADRVWDAVVERWKAPTVPHLTPLAGAAPPAPRETADPPVE